MHQQQRRVNGPGTSQILRISVDVVRIYTSFLVVVLLSVPDVRQSKGEAKNVWLMFMISRLASTRTLCAWHEERGRNEKPNEMA